MTATPPDDDRQRRDGKVRLVGFKWPKPDPNSLKNAPPDSPKLRQAGRYQTMRRPAPSDEGT